VTRPRAADDFATIRARLEELRAERAQAAADPSPASRGQPRRADASRAAVPGPKLPMPIRRAIFR